MTPSTAALALAAVLAAGEVQPAAPTTPATDTGSPPAAAPAASPSAQDPAAATTPPPASPAAAPREAPGALVRRVVEAYGGSRARVRLARVRAVGAITSALHPGEVGRYARTFARGRGLRLEVGFTRSDPEVKLLNGARAWRYGEPAPAAVLAALQVEAARLDLPDLLIDREAQLQDQGEVKHEGQPLRVLGLEISAGARLECGIDPKTARILYVRGVVQSGPRELELFTVFRNFKVVDGVLVAFREEGYANGDSTGDVEIGSVEFLDDVPDTLFQP